MPALTAARMIRPMFIRRNRSNTPSFPNGRSPAAAARGAALLSLLSLLTLIGPVPLRAQSIDEPVKEPRTAEETTIAAPEQTVEVEAPVRDSEIESRLRRILESTDRFRSPKVRVENGVVFLSGATTRPEHKQWARDLASRTQDVVAVVNNIEIAEGPVWNFAPAERELHTLWRDVVQATPLFLIGLVVLMITLLISRGASKLASRILTRKARSAILRGVIEKTILVVIVLFGVYLFLRISGLTRIAVSVIGGTGVAGLILGFAFRDIAENFLASILISIQRPFAVGDTIEVDGQRGIVQKVTTRGTVLMDFEGNFIQLANSTVYKNTIKNYTANPNIRIDYAIGIGYDASITRAQETAQRVLNNHAAVLRDPEPLVLVEQLGASTINLRIYFWIDGHRYSKLKVKSAVMRLTVRALEEGGVSLPDEAREVIFPQPVPVRMLDADSESAPATPRPTPTQKPPVEESDAQATDAEGGLENEANDIQAQADRVRIPESGGDILEAAGKA